MPVAGAGAELQGSFSRHHAEQRSQEPGCLPSTPLWPQPLWPCPPKQKELRNQCLLVMGSSKDQGHDISPYNALSACLGPWPHTELITGKVLPAGIT